MTLYTSCATYPSNRPSQERKTSFKPSHQGSHAMSMHAPNPQSWQVTNASHMGNLAAGAAHENESHKSNQETQPPTCCIAIPHREAKNPDARLIAAQEAGRAEAAAVLERRMAAMEAVMAARRSAPPVIPDPVKDIMEQMKPSTMSRTAGGPGCGNGSEILFQVSGCNRFLVRYCTFLVKLGDLRRHILEV